jgi:hypothetical protein
MGNDMMISTLLKNTVSQFSAVALPHEKENATPVSTSFVTALNAEVASFGYTLDGSLMADLSKLSGQGFSDLRKSLLVTLAELSGKKAAFSNVLFNDFPYSTPDQHNYLLRRVTGYIQNIRGYEWKNYQTLGCGHVIDDTLFNIAEFGACPICQEMSGQISPDVPRYDFASITPLKVLSTFSPAMLSEKVSEMLSRYGSLSSAEREFISEIKNAGIPIEFKAGKVYRETLPIVYSIFGPDAVKDSISGATDILRIATIVSDPAGDLSLTANTRFKISTRHKKNLLRLLEARSNLAEDMLRHRERWLRLGERLNPGSAKNRARYPKVAQAFDDIRDHPKNVATFNRLVEAKVRSKTIDAQLLNTLVSRPTEFARRLDFLLRTSSSPETIRDIMTKFVEAAAKIPTPTLFQMMKYFEYREVGGNRVFIPKGPTNKIKVVEDRRAEIDPSVRDMVKQVIAAVLVRRFAEKPSLGRVYIDPSLKGLLVPFNQRGDSDTNIAITKGSRYPMLSQAPVVRLFAWWDYHTDVDLSVVFLDSEFVQQDHVAFTNLSTSGVVHSGDIQSAVGGGSEFIDMEIDTLLKRGFRYAVMSLISYRGEQFKNFPCFAGFMERDSLRSGHRYEPESVSLKFDVETPATSHMPVIFDLVEREIIFADLAGGNSRYSAVARGGNGDNLATLARGVIELTERKTTVYDVIELHARARGTIVEMAEMADLVLTRENIDVGAVLNELMV